MPKHHILTEFGMGSSLRRQDYTEAAKRGLQNALWRNSINVAELFGREKSEMIIDVDVAVQQPERVDVDVLASIFPYGNITITCSRGGLDVPRPDGNPTVMANVAISVSFEMERADG